MPSGNPSPAVVELLGKNANFVRIPEWLAAAAWCSPPSPPGSWRCSSSVSPARPLNLWPTWSLVGKSVYYSYLISQLQWYGSYDQYQINVLMLKIRKTINVKKIRLSKEHTGLKMISKSDQNAFLPLNLLDFLVGTISFCTFFCMSVSLSEKKIVRL